MIVLYHGKRPWPYSTRFADWPGIRDELREVLAPFQPDFKHVLMDLGQMPMQAIKGRLMTRLALTLMKAVQDNRVLEWLERFGQLLLEFSQKQEMTRQFRAMLRYMFQAEVSAPSTFRDLASKVENTGIKEGVMTIAEQLKQEGRQEGALMGQIQSCQELLNLPVSAVEELAHQTIQDLESLLSRLKAQLRGRVRT